MTMSPNCARQGSYLRFATATALALALQASGCYSYTYNTGLPLDRRAKQTTTRTPTFFGWRDAAPVDLFEMTGGRPVAQFGSYIGPLDWACSVLTVGFVTPRSIFAIPALEKSSAVSPIKED